MKHVNFFLLFSITISIIGCSYNEQPNDSASSNNILIDVTKGNKLSPNKVFNGSYYIQLETTSDCLISNIDKLYITKEYIIVFDQKKNNIYQFDNVGKFVRQIGTKGSGPSEYNEFNDIVYDSDTRKIYAFERFRGLMYIYNLEGILTETISSKFKFNSFIKNKHGYWIYSCFKDNNPDNSLLMLVDDNLSKIKERYFPQAEMMTVQFTPRFTINLDNGEQYFCYNGSNIIWKLSDKAERFYEVNFGNYTLPYKEMAQISTAKEYDKKVYKNDYIGFIDNLLISNDYILFNCVKGGLNKPQTLYTVEYNIGNNITNIYNSVAMEENVIPANYSTPLHLINDSVLVYAIEPQEMYSHEFDILREHIKDVSEDDNPILLFMNKKI